MKNITLSDLNSTEKIEVALTALPYGYRSIFELIRISDKAQYLPTIYRNTAGNYVHEHNGQTLYFAFPVDLFQHLSNLN